MQISLLYFQWSLSYHTQNVTKKRKKIQQNVALSKAYTFTFQYGQTSPKPQKIFHSPCVLLVTFSSYIVIPTSFLEEEKACLCYNPKSGTLSFLDALASLKPILFTESVSQSVSPFLKIADNLRIHRWKWDRILSI